MLVVKILYMRPVEIEKSREYNEDQKLDKAKYAGGSDICALQWAYGR